MNVPNSPLARTAAWAGARVLRSRSLMRAPRHVYHAGFGAVFGSRLLLLEHVGRRSGLRREVMLEVVGHPGADRYVVVSGFGGRAQWFRNVQSDPRVRVSVGRRRAAPARARVLDATEAGQVLTAYVERHQRAWTWFGPVLERTLGRPIDPTEEPPPMVELHVATGTVGN